MPSAKLIFSSVNNKLHTHTRTHTIELPNQVALWLNKWFSPDGSPTELHSVVDYSCTQLSNTGARCVAWRLHIATMDVSYFLHEIWPQSIRTMSFFCLYSYPCSSWIITKPHSIVTILCFLHLSKWPSASDWLRGTLLFAVRKKCNHALDVWTHFLSLLRSLKLKKLFLTTKKIQLIENSAAALYPWFTSQLYYNAHWFQFFWFFWSLDGMTEWSKHLQSLDPRPQKSADDGWNLIGGWFT